MPTRIARALALVVLLAACSKADDAATDSAAAAPSVVLSAQDIATVQSRMMGSEVLVSGNLDPAEMVAVKAQVPGTVTGVRVDRGTPVSRGQVLAVIEAQGIRSQAAGAAAQVAAARAQLALAQQRHEAATRLHDAGAISDMEYRTAQANLEAAQAQLAAAQAGAAGASENAARATIVAPISGVVSARNVRGGEAVNPGAELFTIVDASSLELDGQVSVQDAGRIRAGQSVIFTLDGYAAQVFRGSVARVDPTADPATRQVGVYVRLPNPGRRIVGGLYARGRIETGGTTTALVVPEAAITSRTGDSATVYVLAGNRVARRPVLLGARDEGSGLVAVASGLTAGERVLLNPSSDIGDGTVVSVSVESSATPVRSGAAK